MALDDPILFIFIFAIFALIAYGVFYVLRLLYKANKLADLKLKEMQQEKAGSHQPKKEETH